MLATITPEDVLAVARRLEAGATTMAAFDGRAAASQLIQSLHSVNSNSSWTIFNKKATRMKAISMIIQRGQPLLWMTLNPADTSSPLVTQLAGVELDVSSRLKTDLPNSAKRVNIIAGHPVASADFFHIMIEAVMKALLRFGASDGDGGVLGRIKAYIGMTEGQRRLMLHCHLLVWVYGLNDFASLRDVMDKTPDSYQELTRSLSRAFFSQVASAENVRHSMQNGPEPTGSES